jgi:hypothetical protein
MPPGNEPGVPPVGNEPGVPFGGPDPLAPEGRDGSFTPCLAKQVRNVDCWSVALRAPLVVEVAAAEAEADPEPPPQPATTSGAQIASEHNDKSRRCMGASSPMSLWGNPGPVVRRL